MDAASAIVLLPWGVLPATRLPRRHLSAHWDLFCDARFDLLTAATGRELAVFHHHLERGALACASAGSDSRPSC